MHESLLAYTWDFEPVDPRTAEKRVFRKLFRVDTLESIEGFGFFIDSQLKQGGFYEMLAAGGWGYKATELRYIGSDPTFCGVIIQRSPGEEADRKQVEEVCRRGYFRRDKSRAILEGVQESFRSLDVDGKFGSIVIHSYEQDGEKGLLEPCCVLFNEGDISFTDAAVFDEVSFKLKIMGDRNQPRATNIQRTTGLAQFKGRS